MEFEDSSKRSNYVFFHRSIVLALPPKVEMNLHANPLLLISAQSINSIII